MPQVTRERRRWGLKGGGRSQYISDVWTTWYPQSYFILKIVITATYLKSFSYTLFQTLFPNRPSIEDRKSAVSCSMGSKPNIIIHLAAGSEYLGRITTQDIIYFSYSDWIFNMSNRNSIHTWINTPTRSSLWWLIRDRSTWANLISRFQRLVCFSF